MKTPTATAKQLSFVTSLLLSRDLTGTRFEGHTVAPELDRVQASDAIDELQKLPKASKPQTVIPEGMYYRNGEVFKVQVAVHGSGRLYAKRLNKATGKFDYVRGALSQLREQDRMTLEQAKEFGQLYGICCNCGATLTNEDSIEAGIGPVCASRF